MTEETSSITKLCTVTVHQPRSIRDKVMVYRSDVDVLTTGTVLILTYAGTSQAIYTLSVDGRVERHPLQPQFQFEQEYGNENSIPTLERIVTEVSTIKNRKSYTLRSGADDGAFVVATPTKIRFSVPGRSDQSVGMPLGYWARYILKAFDVPALQPWDLGSGYFLDPVTEFVWSEDGATFGPVHSELRTDLRAGGPLAKILVENNIADMRRESYLDGGPPRQISHVFVARELLRRLAQPDEDVTDVSTPAAQEIADLVNLKNIGIQATVSDSTVVVTSESPIGHRRVRNRLHRRLTRVKRSLARTRRRAERAERAAALAGIRSVNDVRRADNLAKTVADLTTSVETNNSQVLDLIISARDGVQDLVLGRLSGASLVSVLKQLSDAVVSTNQLIVDTRATRSRVRRAGLDALVTATEDVEGYTELS